MSQIVRDGGFNNLPFGIVNGDFIDPFNGFKPDESPDRTVDVVALAGLFSDLTILDATEFFESAVIVFNRPADSLEISSVLMIHGEEIGCPVPLFPILVNGMKNPDKSEFLHMDSQTVIRNREERNRAIVGMVRVHHPVLFDA